MSSIATPEETQVKLQEATVYIDLTAIRQNTQAARDLAPSSELLAMVKANGYGHGILEVSRALDGLADYLGVARMSEAEQLRDAGIDTPIVLMSEHLSISQLGKLKQLDTTPVIYSDSHSEELIKLAESQSMHYWLKLDTGMHRLGISPNKIPSIESLRHCSAIITHFHSADTNPTSIDKQLNQLTELLRGKKSAPSSLGNSASIIRQSRQGDIVRPGVMLYGINPTDTSVKHPLQPVMRFCAPVIDLHHIETGEGVGYNHRWRAKRPSTIATVAAGYGDGYPRQAGDGTPVLINGSRAPLAGTVSMDMITVDVTDLQESGEPVKVGDSAELWGPSLCVTEVAKSANTISYDLITGIQQRVLRQYTTN